MSWKWHRERVASLGVRLVQNDQQHESRKKQRICWPDENAVAVLIDADNTSASFIQQVQSLAERLGPMPLYWVYGNWAAENLKAWQQILHDYRLEARYCKPVALKKNGADIALTVDAMLLYDEGVRKFVLVASDSDYTPLVEVLRVLGCLVLVIGKASAPLALQEATHAFRLIDEIIPEHLCPVYEPPRAAYAVLLPQGDRVGFSDALFEKAMPLPPGASSTQVRQWVLERLRASENTPYRWVPVPSFRDTLRDEVQFKPKEYGYKHLFALLQTFPEAFELRLSPGQDLVHEVRRVQR